jgi:RNA-directed DNA polymerase
MNNKRFISASVVLRSVHAGGNLNNGTNAGLAARNSNNSLANANTNNGSQLRCIYRRADINLASWQNIKTLSNGISSTNAKIPNDTADMKRIGNIYDEFCSIENIKRAFNNAKKGKAHYIEVKEINKNPDLYAEKLHLILKNQQFKNSPYTEFIKVSGGKVRTIKKVPYFPDRIVHHCIVQMMQQTWINSLVRDTFSTIPGRGIHDGVRRVKSAIQDVENTQYCLKLDIKKYFPSVNNGILKDIVRKKIKDQKFLKIIDDIIDSDTGIPIGNYVSQWFGNLYLAYFDHWVKENLKCKYYFRYCDDLVFLSSNKTELWNYLPRIREYLRDNLKLEIKENYQVFPIDKRGLDFLGYRFFHGYTLVRKGVLKNMKKKLDYPKSKSSYWGWIVHANHYRLKEKYFKNEEYAA